jgi:hypothetical protein
MSIDLRPRLNLSESLPHDLCYAVGAYLSFRRRRHHDWDKLSAGVDYFFG